MISSRQCSRLMWELGFSISIQSDFKYLSEAQLFYLASYKIDWILVRVEKVWGIRGCIAGRVVRMWQMGRWMLEKEIMEKRLKRASGHLRKWFPAKTLLDNDGGDSQFLAVLPTKVTRGKQWENNVVIAIVDHTAIDCEMSSK